MILGLREKEMCLMFVIGTEISWGKPFIKLATTKKTNTELFNSSGIHLLSHLNQ